VNVNLTQDQTKQGPTKPQPPVESAAAVPPAGGISVPPGGLIPLDDAGRLLAVEAGMFEIYVLIGPMRHFIAEVNRAAAVMFGGGPKGRLMALAPNGGRLRSLALQELEAAGVESADAASEIDRWVHTLSVGLSRATPGDPPPRPVHANEPVDAVAGEKLHAGQHVLWLLAPEQDALAYLGIVPVRNVMLPITPTTWIECAAPAQLVGRATVDLVKAKVWSQAIAAFHDIAVAATEQSSAAADKAEATRLEERERKTAEDLAAANERLVGVLELRLPRTEPSDDLTFVVQHVTGKPLIRRPGAAGGDGHLDMHLDVAAFGLRARSVDLSGEWWTRDRDNLVGIMREGGALVALVPDWRGRYWIHRRGAKKVRLTDASMPSLESHGFALAEQLPNQKLGWREIGLIAVRLSWLDLGTVAVASLAASLLGLLTPIAMGQVIDTFIPDGLSLGLVQLGAALVLLHVCATLLRACGDVARLRIDGKLSVAIQTGVMDRVLRLPSRFLKAQTSSDLASRVLSIEQVRRTITGTALNTLVTGVFGLSSFALLAWYSPLGALAALVLFVLLIAVSIGTGLAQLKALMAGEVITANLTSLTLQIIQNVSTLRAFGSERRAYALWARNTAAMRSRGLRARFAMIGYETFLAGYDGIALAIVFAALGYAVGGEKTALTTGTLLAFVSAYQGLLGSTQSLSRGIVSLMGLQPTMKRALPLIAETPETAPNARQPGPLSGAFEVSHVSFSYAPNLPLVLNDLTIRVEKGQFVAITGPSGCGKSTLMNLVLGFDKPNSGVVLYDGRNLAELDHAAVRRQIGVVRQSGRLLAGSIFENLVGMHQGTIDDAWQAAELAGIAEDIRAMPMGMHTIVNEGTPTFSGGQVQRMMLARALMGRPRLLLLDEATSALDNAMQSLVAKNVDQLGIARLVVAHRLSTIHNADLIYFMNNGQIREFGTYPELMSKNGEFAEFAKRQTL
jgi:NHLM bacteriocin system ABC transporter ATP-binding protein